MSLCATTNAVWPITPRHERKRSQYSVHNCHPERSASESEANRRTQSRDLAFVSPSDLMPRRFAHTSRAFAHRAIPGRVLHALAFAGVQPQKTRVLLTAARFLG